MFIGGANHQGAHVLICSSGAATRSSSSGKPADILVDLSMGDDRPIFIGKKSHDASRPLIRTITAVCIGAGTPARSASRNDLPRSKNPFSVGS